MEKTNQKTLEEIIRVDHAGERGAIKIYEGQLLALKTIKQDENLKNIVEEMREHEKEHLEYFEKEIQKKLMPFLQKNKLNGEVIVLSQKGMNSWIDQINPSWSGTLPATLIYNRKGRDFYPHSFGYPELEKALKKRL